jgi:hypothetical protein
MPSFKNGASTSLDTLLQRPAWEVPRSRLEAVASLQLPLLAGYGGLVGTYAPSLSLIVAQGTAHVLHGSSTVRATQALHC